MVLNMRLFKYEKSSGPRDVVSRYEPVPYHELFEWIDSLNRIRLHIH